MSINLMLEICVQYPFSVLKSLTQIHLAVIISPSINMNTNKLAIYAYVISLFITNSMQANNRPRKICMLMASGPTVVQ